MPGALVIFYADLHQTHPNLQLSLVSHIFIFSCPMVTVLFLPEIVSKIKYIIVGEDVDAWTTFQLAT